MKSDELLSETEYPPAATSSPTSLKGTTLARIAFDAHHQQLKLPQSGDDPPFRFGSYLLEFLLVRKFQYRSSAGIMQSAKKNNWKLSMQILKRLKRTLLVCMAVIAAVVAGHIIVAMLSILIAVAYLPFSNGSGRGLDFFMNHIFSPLVHFFGGALVFGGTAAVVSASLDPVDKWVKSILAVGVVGGVITATSPSLQDWLGEQGRPIRNAIAWLNQTDAERNKDQVLEFVSKNHNVIQAVGEIKKAYVGGHAMKGGDAHYYDVTVIGEKTVYVIVEPAEQGGSKFVIACITPLYRGQRHSHLHPCKQ